jgi:type IV secretion system protein VirB5
MARIHAKEVFNTPKSAAETRFNKVITQYDDYINKLINDNKVWRMIGLLSILMIVMTIFGWFRISLMKKYIPVIVEVNELGRARYIGDLSVSAYNHRNFLVQDYMIEALIGDFIRYTREIYTDADVMAQNITKAAYYCSYDMQDKLKHELQADDPFSKIGRVRIRVAIESNIKITEQTWQIDWYDILQGLNGVETSRTRYRGLFTILVRGFDESRTDEERSRNPLGVYIIDYNISRINEVSR